MSRDRRREAGRCPAWPDKEARMKKIEAVIKPFKLDEV
jgi:hypothetical protein